MHFFMQQFFKLSDVIWLKGIISSGAIRIWTEVNLLLTLQRN